MVPVVSKGARPIIPSGCLPVLSEIMIRCWDDNPDMMHGWTDFTEQRSNMVLGHKNTEEGRVDEKQKRKRKKRQNRWEFFFSFLVWVGCWFINYRRLQSKWTCVYMYCKRPRHWETGHFCWLRLIRSTGCCGFYDDYYEIKAHDMKICLPFILLVAD